MKEESKQVRNKREEEKVLVTWMIQYYCRKHKHSDQVPCDNCQELIKYANNRVDRCPMMETKTFCSNCKIHCYRPEMRKEIKEVMRYAGPRMLFHHPVKAIHHLIEDRKEKKVVKLHDK